MPVFSATGEFCNLGSCALIRIVGLIEQKMGKARKVGTVLYLQDNPDFIHAHRNVLLPEASI